VALSGNQILHILETHGIRQTPNSLKRYLYLIFMLLNAAKHL